MFKKFENHLLHIKTCLPNSVILRCLGKYVEGLRDGNNIEIFPCPNCRSELTLKSDQDVAELPSIFFITNLLEIMAAQEKAKTTTSCSPCQKPAATSHCTSCEIFMCKECSEAHAGWFQDHEVLSKENMCNPACQAKMKAKLYRIKHKDEVLKYYCEKCKELCCIDCVVLNHQKPKHSCVAVSELAEKQRETLQSSCTTLDEKLSKGTKALNNICEVMKRFEKNATSAKDNVKEQKEEILKIVAEKLDEKVKKISKE